MTLDQIINDAIEPVMAMWPSMDSREARVMLLAIGLQESRFTHRYQVVQGKPGAKGPARGFWQFEQGGGVKGVLNFNRGRPNVAACAQALCVSRGVPGEAKAVWLALEHDDVLAAGFARLLLRSDPYELPKLGDAEGAWQLYLRTWRPGKPHRKTWDALYKQALESAL